MGVDDPAGVDLLKGGAEDGAEASHDHEVDGVRLESPDHPSGVRPTVEALGEVGALDEL